MNDKLPYQLSHVKLCLSNTFQYRKEQDVGSSLLLLLLSRTKLYCWGLDIATHQGLTFVTISFKTKLPQLPPSMITLQSHP